jgi:hypothetical protein
MEADGVPSWDPDSGYNRSAIAGAVLLTLFFPFISLIAALLLQGGQSAPRKKSQLRSWAWASGAWLVFGVVVWVLLTGGTLN